MTETPTEPTIRPYDAATDRNDLWTLKEAFERELGAGGGTEKERTYDAKLDSDYRERYLGWVDRCVTEGECMFVAEVGNGLEGYVFLLPASLAMIWDAAVVNEVYVQPTYRGTGLSDALFAAALDHARGQDLPLDRVVLDVDEENGRARAFYARHGFEGWAEMVAREL
jgi:GNAT superfamily N-acetyltransferase